FFFAWAQHLQFALRQNFSWFISREEIAKFGSKGLPSSLIRQQDMVLTFKRHKTSVWNGRSEPAARLERHHRITSDMKDEGRYPELSGLGTNVERIECIPELSGICRRSATSLEFADPPELLFGCIGHQQICKNFSKCSGFLSPAQFDHFR